MPDCHYCAGHEHCKHCNPGNPATDEQMAARQGITVAELNAARANMMCLISDHDELTEA